MATDSHNAIHTTLQRVFGYDRLRPGQEATISAVVAGRSAAAIFPTGSGKSLCYQLPALLLPHLTLVISPLLALMQDQLAFLAGRGVAAASIDSAQSREEASAVMTRVRRGEIKVLMISVERLKNERFRQFIAQVPISLMVIDEAHCISEWGHNFRPDYLKLPDYQRQFAIPQALLLTATPQVIADMQARFAIADDDVIATGFYRANLNLLIEPVASGDKQRRLVEWLSPRLQAGREQPSVVYVTQQQSAEQLATALARHGLDARAYHAGLPTETRDTIQRQFMTGEVACIVATIAFGMGIDKADIRNVVHFDLPKSVENYSQEIGRAGRDGRPSDCLVLANRDALNVLENFVYGDTPERDGIRRVLEEIAAVQDGSGEYRWELTLNALSQHSNIRPLPLKTLLVQLELRGVIAPRFSYFAEYRYKYLREPEALVATFEGERQRFVQLLIETSSRARTWCSVDFDALYQRGIKAGINAERSRVVSALEYFNDKGWIMLESKQMTEVYAVTPTPLGIDALSAELHGYFKAKEDSEIARINAMLALFESDACLSHRLARYFGDTQAPEHCGHCSVCQGQVARLPPPVPLPPLEAQSFAALCGELIARHQATFGGRLPGVELVTRFLCGIATPLFTRLKARQIKGFAQLESYPYAEVRRWVAGHLAGDR
ncbi:RecQ family ATP-dependent DNA helicase [Halomonas sp. McH1-25]|uniref:RecQ family ATP-dependent DNA helicase n=3 Tax=Halomonas TaxID=2745 RepID=UPI001EF5FDDB|nr:MULTISPECIES: RecQ family ATP-dependent DNA helicase [unclassified Halomonas]MCG7599658.1 RecQ family ATP-dependent DNA helicase [Halomonas sp. McH1-25]MCP1342578.1 RecQ family ATP-dependent DNA helicase [Halomonas sp. FL8]